MIILMAGLPGTGKTTLARELAARTSGAVLNKDEIRAAIFSADDIEYSTEQDDFCVAVMLDAAAYLLRRSPQRRVFLDGRPFSRKSQIDQVKTAAANLNQSWHVIECICADQTARRRIFEATTHPAANRDWALYLHIKERFEEIHSPKTVIDTDQPLEECLQQAMQALKIV